MQPSRPGADTDGTIVLDRQFGAATLSALRAAVLECASTAGLPRDRSIDVMLALHELAANAIRHGAGQGWLRIRVTAAALRCQVGDAGMADQPGQVAAGEAVVSTRETGWPVKHGHGLWLVRKTADQVQITAGPEGSVVSVTFKLPDS